MSLSTFSISSSSSSISISSTNILSLQVYDRVRTSCWRLASQAQEPLSPIHAYALCVPPVPFEAHLAIFLQQHNKLIRTTHHLHLKKAHLYAEQWKDGKSITEIAKEKHVNFPPCSMLRLILPYISSNNSSISSVGKSTNSTSGSTSVLSSSSEETTIIGQYNKDQIVNGRKFYDEVILSSLNAADIMKDPSKIVNERLRKEVIECIECDSQVSPWIDRIRAYIGAEHEYRLQRLIHALSLRKSLSLPIEFETEQELRLLKYKKTPDIRFKRPIIVKCPHGEEKCRANGGKGEHMICWIDSKATFGDPFTHEKSNESQVKAYTTLFGPGLVIYWLGFVETLSTCLVPSKKGVVPSQNVLLWTDLPTRWRFSTDSEWNIIRKSLPPPPLPTSTSTTSDTITQPIGEIIEEDVIDEDLLLEDEVTSSSNKIDDDTHKSISSLIPTIPHEASHFDVGLFGSTTEVEMSTSLPLSSSTSSTTFFLNNIGTCLQASNLLMDRQRIQQKRRREGDERVV
jgi:hypothetical protein